jgi:hypothetical protein
VNLKESFIKQIITAVNYDFKNLELQYNQIQRKLKHEKVEQLSLKDLRNLLAYETWKDGAELDMIQEIIDAKQKDYTTKIDLLKNLEIYGY